MRPIRGPRSILLLLAQFCPHCEAVLKGVWPRTSKQGDIILIDDVLATSLLILKTWTQRVPFSPYEVTAKSVDSSPVHQNGMKERGSVNVTPRARVSKFCPPEWPHKQISWLRWPHRYAFSLPKGQLPISTLHYMPRGGRGGEERGMKTNQYWSENHFLEEKMQCSVQRWD